MIGYASSTATESRIGLPERSDPGGYGHLRWSPYHAHALTTAMLRGSSDRLAHSLQAAMQARRVLAAVSTADADLLVSAALLHDIGYAPALRQTGFHPIDGARFLLRLGAPTRLAALVAHHSESRLLAEAVGLLAPLSSFLREEGPVTDALTYADMTAGPTGAPMTIADRLADIAARHANEDPVLVAARLARVPRLMATAERVRSRALVTDPAPL
jgi:putative nucleotidyltransferase with HDIG domain